MAHHMHPAKARTAVMPPRGATILGLALMSWILVVLAWNAVSLTFSLVAGA